MSLRSILILSTYLRLGLRNGLFPSGFQIKILYLVLGVPMHSACPAHLLFLDFITIVFGEEIKV
jgi:hypothetical protein